MKIYYYITTESAKIKTKICAKYYVTIVQNGQLKQLV